MCVCVRTRAQEWKHELELKAHEANMMKMKLEREKAELLRVEQQRMPNALIEANPPQSSQPFPE